MGTSRTQTSEVSKTSEVFVHMIRICKISPIIKNGIDKTQRRS